MKRLAAAVAAAVLGSGCIVAEPTPSCDHPATLQWSLARYDGTGLNTCPTGVDSVDVWVNGGHAGTFYCTDYGATVNLASGTNDVVVQAIYNASGDVAFRDRFSVDVTACGDQGVIPVVLAEGALQLTAQLPGACYTTSGTSLHADVRDDTTAVVLPLDWQCGTVLTQLLPAGPHTILGVWETDGSGYVVRALCSNSSLTIASQATSPATYALGAASAACAAQ